MTIQIHYIDFIEKKPLDLNRITRIFEVVTKTEGTVLGRISWFPRWRKYCFFTEPGTIYDKSCLNLISEFLQHLMDERNESNGPNK